MADVYEQNLASKSTLTTTDYIRVVGSDNVSYKQLVSDVAKKIIENYTGSTLAGSAQSVKSALDSLNSNTGNIKMKRVSKQVAIADGSTSSPTTTTIDVSGDIGAGHTLVGVFATIGAYTLPYAPTSGTMQTWLYRLTASSNEIVIENTTTGWGTQTVALLLFFI